MDNTDYNFGELEKSFLGRQGFKNFVSNMQFKVFEADVSRPDTMFVRIGLAQMGPDKQIGVTLEADYRLFRRWFNLPKGVSSEVILTLCLHTSLTERKKMLEEMPILAEKHIEAFKTINNILE